MDALRWILLLVGIFILIAIYMFGKRSDTRRAGRDRARDEPHFHQAEAEREQEMIDPDDEWDIIPIHREETDRTTGETHLKEAETSKNGDSPSFVPVEKGKSETPLPEQSDVTSPEPSSDQSATDFEEILIIHVVAIDAPMTGERLTAVFSELDLTLDARGIYIRCDGHSSTPLFGVVNMVKPGIFSQDSIESLETPGISLFLTLPGPDSPMIAFRAMSDCAHRLADRLHARLEDETHSTLSNQTLMHLEERVRGFIQHRAQIEGPLK